MGIRLSPMGQAESSPPLVEINYDELTYELLLEESKEQDREEAINTNKPDSLIQRALMDVVGMFFLYMGTFVVCDLMRTMKTGKWTRLLWAFLGPWTAANGAPLLNKLVARYEKKHGTPLDNCQALYDANTGICNKGSFLLPGPWHLGTGGEDYDECMLSAEQQLNDCIMNTDEYRDCHRDNPSTLDDPVSGSSEYYCLDKLGGYPQAEL